MQLHNKYDKNVLKEIVGQEKFARTTISFYRYVHIQDPDKLRDELYLDWMELGVLGRIYLAKEGINAQLSVPEHNVETFKAHLDSTPFFAQMPLKTAVEEPKTSFYKLKIKVRHKILADGLNDDTFDVTDTGQHLSAKEFNEAMNKEGTIVIDMRNHYESEVGHFEGAVCPESDTFRDELPMVKEVLKGKEDQKVLLYCTGGIRCEKASAWLKHEGFTDVNQLRGGIIDYARQVKEEGLDNKFHGSNFVFDDRLGERISDEVISECHQCGEKCDTHTNCANDDCHLLFIQCEKCAQKYDGCCTPKCQETAALPEEEQRKLRKNKKDQVKRHMHHSRLRPSLKQIIQDQEEKNR